MDRRKHVLEGPALVRVVSLLSCQLLVRLREVLYDLNFLTQAAKLLQLSVGREGHLTLGGGLPWAILGCFGATVRLDVGLATREGGRCLDMGHWAPWVCTHGTSGFVVRVWHLKLLEVDGLGDADLGTAEGPEEFRPGLFFFLHHLVVHHHIVLKVLHLLSSLVVAFIPAGEVVIFPC